MTSYLKALLLPNFNSVAISQIASTIHSPAGVGLLNERGRMIGWIEIPATDEQMRRAHIEKILRILSDIINNPRLTEQPDFSFLTDQAGKDSKSSAGAAPALTQSTTPKL